MTTLWHDIRYSLRMLRKNLGITAIAVVTLALGMAGNTVIFSFFNAFFLRPLPFYQPDRLVDLDETAPRWNLGYTGLAYPDFCAWRQQNRSFDGMAAWTMGSLNLFFEGGAQRVRGAQVTYDLPSVLGIPLALGRPFTPEEDRPGGDKVVLLSHGLWLRLFGGQDVLGKVVHLDNEPYTIIGVLAGNKALINDEELWTPLAANPDDLQRGWYMRGFGRLKAGVTMAMASDDLLRVHQARVADHKANENTAPRLTTITERIFGDTRPVLTILMGAVVVVLLIACGNVAALMLARGLARWRELGIRLSLGATAGRVARLILTESLLVSCLAGALGLALGYWGLHVLLDFLADKPPQWVSFRFDVRVWLWVSLMILVTAAFGALPTCRTVIRGSLQGALASSGRQSTAAPTRRRGLHALVVGEVALTLVLLIQAGLLVQAFRFVQKMDPGYRADHVLICQIALPEAQYRTAEAWEAFYRSSLEQIRALPGVVSASAVTAPPLGGHWGTFFTIENAPAKRPDEQDPVVLQRVAFPGYFETMGIALLAGRTFNDQDGRTEGSLAVIVNETFARRFWPNQDPVGKRIHHRNDKAPWMTVVGVARDVKHYGQDRPMIPGVYLPYAQDRRSAMAVVVRTATEPLELVSGVREVVRRSDPALAIYDVTTMSDRLHQSLWLRRLYSSLIGAFAAVALVMAVGGMYGVFSYVVGGRTREIGVRLALGAQGGSVLWMVLRQGLILAAAGIAIGLCGTLIAVPLMRRLLLGVHGMDLLICALIPFVLTAVALLACYIPARRAAKIDPMVALRCE
jgi:putative ABC transport system permease protein